MRNKSNMPDKRPVIKKNQNRQDAVYYYCPHCKESHDPSNEGETPGEVKCPVCGEIYEEK